MPVLNGKELRIVGFLCNWCSYGGADTAGVARATQPTDLRIIRVPCSGRIDPLFIVRALLNGADGVLVSGCHPRDCHYSAGNYYARRRLEVLKQFLPVLGIDERRFEYTWVSASEGQRWQHVVTTFTDRIHKLGPAPRFEDFGGGDVLIRQIPSDVDVEDAKALLQELAGDLLAGKTLDPDSLRDNLLHTIACKSAIKAGWQTSDEELRRLVQEVLSRDDIKYCPHGRPVCVTLTKRQLEKQFKRV